MATEETYGYPVNPHGEQSEVFNVQSLSLSPVHNLTCVSIESQRELQHLLPTDWRDKLVGHVSQADLVIPEYFDKDLEANYSSFVFGAYAKYYADRNLHVYTELAGIAKEQDKQVAVMDVANNWPVYMGLECLLPYSIAYTLSSRSGKGLNGKEPGKFEHIVPSPTDARRMLTAAGIRQETERWPEGGNFLYVAAPSHVSRVIGYLTTRPTKLDRARYATYKSRAFGLNVLDKAVRTYQHDPEAGWQRVGYDPIV